MRFSVIIPHYNAEDTIQRAIKSVPDSAEKIIVGDPEQFGPGWARNQGLDMATGDWIVFLDADDELAPGALDKIAEQIELNPEVDLVDYGPNGRYVHLLRAEFLMTYLQQRMDGSVVFSAFRKSFLDKHSLRFADGLHEDVDFMFKAYKYAHCVTATDAEIYVKHDTPGAITSGISKRHIDGILRAWREIKKEMPPGMLADYMQGFTGMIATRVRAIHEILGKSKKAEELYEYLYSHKV